MGSEATNLTYGPCLASNLYFQLKWRSRSSELYSSGYQRLHNAMKREQALIDALLDEIESMPIGNGGSVPVQHFFLS